MLYAKVAQKEPDSTRCAFSELIEACRSSPLHLRYNLKIRTYLPEFHSTILPPVPFPNSWAVDIGNGTMVQVSTKRGRLCSSFQLSLSSLRFSSISVLLYAADAGTRNCSVVIRKKHSGPMHHERRPTAPYCRTSGNGPEDRLGEFSRKLNRSSRGLRGANRQSR